MKGWDWLVTSSTNCRNCKWRFTPLGGVAGLNIYKQRHSKKAISLNIKLHAYLNISLLLFFFIIIMQFSKGLFVATESKIFTVIRLYRSR